jgi:hypothetical protein
LDTWKGLWGSKTDLQGLGMRRYGRKRGAGRSVGELNCKRKSTATLLAPKKLAGAEGVTLPTFAKTD